MAYLNGKKILFSPKVYIDASFEEGRQAERNAFWVDYQDNGERTDYSNAFAGIGWHNGNFKPTNDITVKRAYMMFRDSAIEGDLVEIAKNLGITVDFTGCQNYQYAFYNSKFTRLGVIDTSNVVAVSNLSVMFYGATLLHTIDKFITPLSNQITYTNIFQNCTALENITIEGVINREINLQWSPLSVASMKSIISCLENYAGTSNDGAYTLYFNDDCWARLEADSAAPDGGTWKDYVRLSLGWAV